MEILIIGGVVLLLFGASAIPKLARSIGKAKKEFEKGMKEGASEIGGDEDEASRSPDNSGGESSNNSVSQ
jgi:sec-independent protein translocase protein TatA